MPGKMEEMLLIPLPAATALPFVPVELRLESHTKHRPVKRKNAVINSRLLLPLLRRSLWRPRHANWVSPLQET